MSNYKKGREKFPDTIGKSLKTGYKRSDKPFRWTLVDCEWEHAGWKIDTKTFAVHIITKLQDYEMQKWQDVVSANGGKSLGHGTNNHFINATKLPDGEKVYFIKHKYMEKYEEVFSLRLDAKKRLIGFVDMNVFHALWYDAEHKIFPSER